MTNTHNTETRFTVGDSGTLNRENVEIGTVIRNMTKIHNVTLTDTYVILAIHAKLFSMMRVLKEGFQVIPEGENLIIKKTQPKLVLTRKRPTTAAYFILTSKLYNKPSGPTNLGSKKRNLKEKEYKGLEGT